MTSRRHLLKTAAAAAGMVFCSCALLDAARAQQPGGRRIAAAGHGQWQARQDGRRPCPLPVSRSRKADGRRHRGLPVADEGGREAGLHHGHARRAPQGDGRTGRRHGGAVDQPVLVSQGSRPGRRDRPGTERKARRTLRVETRPLRRFRLAGAAIPRSRRPAARNRDEKTGAARRRDRRQRRRRRNSPTRNSIRSGPRPKNSAPCCSSIRRPSRNSPTG